MALLQRLLARGRPRSQQQTAGRAAEVIEKVIFDVGVEALVNGTLLLDRRFRPRFVGLMPVTRSGVIAAVSLAQVPEAALLRAQPGAALPVSGLVDGLMREFKAQSPAFRALP